MQYGRIIIFKFQSDSINTEITKEYLQSTVIFKFQSDSINTVSDDVLLPVHHVL